MLEHGGFFIPICHVRHHGNTGKYRHRTRELDQLRQIDELVAAPEKDADQPGPDQHVELRGFGKLQIAIAFQDGDAGIERRDDKIRGDGGRSF